MRSALHYIDENGLGALSMHKLGAALDVKGMSLYHYIDNKDDLLDEVVEMLWSEVEVTATPVADWRSGIRSLAWAMRNVVRCHPAAASLIFSQQVMPNSALRVIQAHTEALITAGFAEIRAYDLVRTITSYALGCAFSEITWDTAEASCAVDVRSMLQPDTPPDLVAVAEVFCGQSAPDAQFETGLDLMLRGMNSPRDLTPSRLTGERDHADDFSPFGRDDNERPKGGDSMDETTGCCGGCC